MSIQSLYIWNLEGQQWLQMTGLRKEVTKETEKRYKSKNWGYRSQGTKALKMAECEKSIIMN